MDDYLYHGTRVPKAIQASNTIIRAPSGYKCVSLTSDMRIAEHFATLRRDEELDEGGGAVLVLDAKKLSEHFNVIFFDDPDAVSFESEFQIWDDIEDLPYFLVETIYENGQVVKANTEEEL